MKFHFQCHEIDKYVTFKILDKDDNYFYSSIVVVFKATVNKKKNIYHFKRVIVPPCLKKIRISIRIKEN